jgi:hypothetical protein
VTPESEGNAVGLGLADFTTRAVANRIDLAKMYLNAVTSTTAEGAYLPVILPDQRSVLQAVVATCWQEATAAVRLCQICSTLHLDEILVSPALYRDLEGQANATRLSEPAPLEFDGEGRLLTRCGPLGL